MKQHHKHLTNVAGKVDSFFDRVFENVEITAPDSLDASLKDAHVMIAATHRSQADYFLLGKTLHFLGVKNLRFAAGDNLTNLPVIGPKFRKWGAFTVERDRSSSRSYIVDLCEKTASMLEHDDNIIVFPEMGRSYKGNMLEIKQVIITAAILVQARQPSRRVVYLPCAISYEMLPELAWFGLLQRGKKLRKPDNPFVKRLVGSVFYFGADIVAFAKFLNAHRIGIKYGSVYVDFGDPVPVAEIVDLKADHNPQASGEFWAYRGAARKVSADLYRRLQGLYRLLPAHLVAGAVAGGARTKAESADSVERILLGLRAQNRNLRSLDGREALLLVEAGAKRLRAAKALDIRGDTLVTRTKSILDYYAAALA